MRLIICGAEGPAMSVRCITASDGSPSYLRVNAITMILYSVYAPAQID